MRKATSRFLLMAVATLGLFLILVLFAILPYFISAKKTPPTTGAFLSAAVTSSIFFVAIAAVVLILFWRHVVKPRQASNVKQE